MTQIQVNLKDSYGVSLVGYIQVKLDYVLVNQTTDIAYLPISQKVNLAAGQATLTLEPSELAHVTYVFEVYQTVTIDSVSTSYLVWSFRAKVPDSPTAIPLFDLMTETGIYHDAMDSSLSALARRLYLDDNFWSRFQTEIIRARGAYSSTNFYRRGDWVTYQGGSYIYINSTIAQGNSPLSSTYWQQMAAKGEPGAGTSGDDNPYDQAAWDGSTSAPSRNAVRDIIETLATKTALDSKISATSPSMSSPTRSDAQPLSDRNSQLVSSSWVQQNLDTIRKALVPVGTVVAYAGTSAPTGWLFCDGNIYLLTAYPALGALLKPTYDGADVPSTYFRVPDLRGRFVSGADTLGTTLPAANRMPSVVAGNSGGLYQITLTNSNMPAHNHGGTTGGMAASNPFTARMLDYSVIGTGSDQGFTYSNVSSASQNIQAHTHNIPTDGGSTPVNILPPYQAMSYIIYTGV